MTKRHGAAHGDLLLVPCEEPAKRPDIAMPEHGRLVLARGEHTGHHHSIDADAGAFYRFRPDDMPALGSVGYLRIDEASARLEHLKGGSPTGEHDALDIAPGWYEVRLPVEESDDEEDRLVQD